VSRINREAYERTVLVNSRTYQVLQTALEVGQHSAGLFDVTVAPLVHELISPSRPGISAQCEVHSGEAIALLPGNGVRLRRPNTKIDLGGIAKGFAVDRAIDVLRKHDVRHGLVNAGGDVATFGFLPQAIHVRDPRIPSRSLCRVKIKDAALASSARAFDLVQSATPLDAMIIDPAGRQPVQGIVGATVRAPSCMVADALTKVVMISGERALAVLEKYQASAFFVRTSGEILMTPEWQDAIAVAA
jgi:FAD:protein FMN transferase